MSENEFEKSYPGAGIDILEAATLRLPKPSDSMRDLGHLTSRSSIPRGSDSPWIAHTTASKAGMAANCLPSRQYR